MSCIKRSILAAAFVLGAWFHGVPEAVAAQGYDNCNNFIDSLPATISTQGVWCLRKDLSTSMTSGEAIRIATNNVTIDCNDFKVGGLAAGEGTTAAGIFTEAGRKNATIRNCNVRGFSYGIHLSAGGGGHLVEDNLVDHSRRVGIHVQGAGNRVQRNRVFDTGGSWSMLVVGGSSASVTAMQVSGDVFDNVVSNVFSSSTADTVSTTGIRVAGDGHDVRRNQVRGLMARGPNGRASGIDAGDSAHSRIEANHLAAAAPGIVLPGTGVVGRWLFDVFCGGNTIVGFAQPVYNCTAFRPNLTD